MYDICWDPPLPDEWQDAPQKAVLLHPTEKLSFDQLRELSMVLDFREENFLLIRKRLCDGDSHTLVSGLFPAQLSAIVGVLERIGIGYDVVSPEHATGPSIAIGLRSDFEF